MKWKFPDINKVDPEKLKGKSDEEIMKFCYVWILLENGCIGKKGMPKKVLDDMALKLFRKLKSMQTPYYIG